jgi:hypothetical protein
MPRTTDQIQSDIDAVLSAAATPEQEIRLSDGRTVIYRTEDMRQKALRALREELAQALPPVQRTRTFLFFGGKGIGI